MQRFLVPAVILASLLLPATAVLAEPHMVYETTADGNCKRQGLRYDNGFTLWGPWGPVSTVDPDTTKCPTSIGLPEDDCEEPFVGTLVHPYGPATGRVLSPPRDGAVPPCAYGDGTWDGHLEFALGGAWLLAAEPGASICFGGYADHDAGTEIFVYDVAFWSVGSDVAFSVASDNLNNMPPLDPNAPNCGDHESDFAADCVNRCTPGFPPGLDGSYQVYVQGTSGHVVN